MNKLLITIGAAIGGIIGAYIPFLWGDTDIFSGWSILLATVGGIVGIWAGFKLAQRIG
ncbi:hypothetical protein J0I05_03405 [Candidatus Saccharibacteria bacterium]|nr:hypothetical protein [Candidatus Saccharibacteria bacterium]